MLTSLQRSVQAVLTGKTRPPDWLSHGIRDQSRVAAAILSDRPMLGGAGGGEAGVAAGGGQPVMASDGRFLYIHSATHGLWKVGSGFANTILVSGQCFSAF